MTTVDALQEERAPQTLAENDIKMSPLIKTRGVWNLQLLLGSATQSLEHYGPLNLTTLQNLVDHATETGNTTRQYISGTISYQDCQGMWQPLDSPSALKEALIAGGHSDRVIYDTDDGYSVSDGHQATLVLRVTSSAVPTITTHASDHNTKTTLPPAPSLTATLASGDNLFFSQQLPRVVGSPMFKTSTTTQGSMPPRQVSAGGLPLFFGGGVPSAKLSLDATKAGQQQRNLVFTWSASGGREMPYESRRHHSAMDYLGPDGSPEAGRLVSDASTKTKTSQRPSFAMPSTTIRGQQHLQPPSHVETSVETTTTALYPEVMPDGIAGATTVVADPERDAMFKQLTQRLEDTHQLYRSGLLDAKEYHERLTNLMVELHNAHPIPTTAFFQGDQMSPEVPPVSTSVISTATSEVPLPERVEKETFYTGPILTIAEVVAALKILELAHPKDFVVQLPAVLLCLISDAAASLRLQLKEATTEKSETQQKEEDSLSSSTIVVSPSVAAILSDVKAASTTVLHLASYAHVTYKAFKANRIVELKSKQNRLRLLATEAHTRKWKGQEVLEFLASFLETLYGDVPWDKQVMIVRALSDKLIAHAAAQQRGFQELYIALDFLFPGCEADAEQYLIHVDPKITGSDVSFSEEPRCHGCQGDLQMFRFRCVDCVRYGASEYLLCSQCFQTRGTSGPCTAGYHSNASAFNHRFVCELPLHVLLPNRRGKYQPRHMRAFTIALGGTQPCPMQIVPGRPSLLAPDAHPALAKAIQDTPGTVTALPSGGVRVVSQTEQVQWTQLDNRFLTVEESDKPLLVQELISGETKPSSQPDEEPETKLIQTIRVENAAGEVHSQSYVAAPAMTGLLDNRDQTIVPHPPALREHDEANDSERDGSETDEFQHPPVFTDVPLTSDASKPLLPQPQDAKSPGDILPSQTRDSENFHAPQPAPLQPLDISSDDSSTCDQNTLRVPRLQTANQQRSRRRSISSSSSSTPSKTSSSASSLSSSSSSTTDRQKTVNQNHSEASKNEVMSCGVSLNEETKNPKTTVESMSEESAELISASLRAHQANHQHPAPSQLIVEEQEVSSDGAIEHQQRQPKDRSQTQRLGQNVPTTEKEKSAREKGKSPIHRAQRANASPTAVKQTVKTTPQQGKTPQERKERLSSFTSPRARTPQGSSGSSPSSRLHSGNLASKSPRPAADLHRRSMAEGQRAAHDATERKASRGSMSTSRLARQSSSSVNTIRSKQEQDAGCPSFTSGLSGRQSRALRQDPTLGSGMRFS